MTQDGTAEQSIEDQDEAPNIRTVHEDVLHMQDQGAAVTGDPLGWDRQCGYRTLFPDVTLPFHVAERVQFGNPDCEPNRLVWGDNLHVMRQLPSESVDLIYIDPPFFSGRDYAVTGVNRDGSRIFSDTWSDGLSGYLIWLNARLYEMKRLLTTTGSLFVHCDWHASHYIKIELDKLFGYDRFINEIIWTYGLGGSSSRHFSRKHDVIFFYSKTKSYRFQKPTIPATSNRMKGQSKGMPDVWTDIPSLNNRANERLGYPTQKPEALIARVILSASHEGDIVADFFCGSGTTACVAQRLGRRWIACDQSAIATRISADRLTRHGHDITDRRHGLPDFTLEHWGIYGLESLSALSPSQFRRFVCACFGAQDGADGIHGYRGLTPIWVGAPTPDEALTGEDVMNFAKAIRKTERYRQGHLQEGIMLAWDFCPEARDAAKMLRHGGQGATDRLYLEMLDIGSTRFRDHVTRLSTDHADYGPLLTFVPQPPPTGACCTGAAKHASATPVP